MRIIITGGGTGGHIFPAVEIAEELLRRKKDVIFVGNKQSLEENIAKSKNIPFFGLSVKKLVGQGFLAKLLALVYLKWAVIHSLYFLIKTRPHAIIGMGGYVSAPMILASFILGIKRYVCEQNVVPGFANKLLAKISTRVFISFDESFRYFSKEKTTLTGNPIRSDFFSIPVKDGKLSKILVTGGSLGAHYINQQLPALWQELQKDCPELSITHQTGVAALSHVKDRYQRVSLPASVISFIDNMPQKFEQHNLIISRAGATICAEIMASGMPSILIPYPFANGHQRYNALALEKQNAALMVEEGPHFKQNLISIIKGLYNDQKRLNELSKTAKSLAKEHAAKTIVDQVLRDP
jgi:UDP-N-acetylglucosamine--N-acetylmuramyl-(pentapeptide) pyrophosphoryl-undecaprenol N-acetylglucosamine transferase